MDTNRRDFLKFAGTAAGLMVTASKAFAAAPAQVCEVTPEQTSGPFYPGEKMFSADNDLTVVNGKQALGQLVLINGYVLDQHCQPVPQAAVEIWQACASGRYNNANDPNPAPLDPNFKYWGETFTDADGRYHFKTIQPGAYPADTDWMRPPHIHFKITKLGYRELITQMYFAGNPYNEKDLILEGVPEAERPSVIVNFLPTELSGFPIMGDFNITLRSLR